MRIGLAVPQYGFSLPSGQIRAADAIEWGSRAEALGFDSVWLSDHFFYSFARYGAGDEPIAALEPETTLAAIGSVTSRVRLGILVECATFRHPALVAKAAATTDQLSGGRVDVGLGAGWFEQEFEAFGYPFGTVGERFDALEDALAITSGLFGGVDPLTHQGRVWSLHDGRLTPPPVQRPIPIWAGGKGGPRLLRAAARWAHGWNTVWRMAPDAYADQVAAVRDACAAVERDPATFGLSIGLYGTIGRTEADAEAAFERARTTFPGDAMRDESWATWRDDTVSGSVDQVRERSDAFAALGVTDLVVSPWALPFTIAEAEQVDLFAEALVGR
jgi:alkanesulfonate monooxygenase SsuD/methylene tetrahydromethanopterin reductase-like flavin-dependent oxidoreductase (luciferase family)